MNYRVLVVGESLIDVVVAADGTVVEYPGGSPMNVAIGLGRLGLEVELHSSVGDDERGDRITAHLLDSNVRLTGSTRHSGATSSSTARIDGTGAASYTFDVTNDLAPLDLGGAVDHVHIGSIGAVVQPGAATVASIVAANRAQATLSYDPNIRAALMGDAATVRPVVEAIVRQSDIVKASDEDLRWLFPHAEPAETAARWALSGAAIVVVTHGADGAQGFAGRHTTQVPGPALTVHDTIGAGDSFMAGLIAAAADRALLGAANRVSLAEISTHDLEYIVAFASRCAAVTVTRPGADPPTRAEIA